VYYVVTLISNDEKMLEIEILNISKIEYVELFILCNWFDWQWFIRYSLSHRLYYKIFYDLFHFF
jgi:hypothetical protein